MRDRARGALAVAVGFVICVAVGAQTTDVEFVNDTGATIYFLYASPTTADTWGEDLLGSTVFPDGATFRARLFGARALDIRAVDSNGNEYIVWNWGMRPQSRVIIRQEAFVGTGDTVGNEAITWLSVRNETNYTVRQVIIVPASGGDWDSGERFLQNWEAIQDGESYRLEIDLDDADSLIYDVMLIDEDGDRYVKWDVNLALVTEIVYTLDDLIRP